MPTTGGPRFTVEIVGGASGESVFPDAALLADDAALPETTIVGAVGMWYDGATLDLARGDATNGLLVNLGANNDVDTELSAAAAYAVDLSPPSAGGVRSFPFLYDGTNLQPQATMQEVVVIASGARTSFSQSVQTNRSGFKGIIVHMNVTGAGTGTLQVRVWNRVDAANAYSEGVLVQGTTLNTTGTRLIMAYPGLNASTPPTGYNTSSVGVLGKYYYIDVVHSDSSSWTYGIGAVLLP